MSEGAIAGATTRARADGPQERGRSLVERPQDVHVALLSGVTFRSINRKKKQHTPVRWCRGTSE